MEKFEFILGSTLRDKVTGFTGIATSRVVYLNGCVQYGISPKVKEGEMKHPDTEYIDVSQLEFIDAGVYVPMKETGGPQHCPKH